jgi:hypothetical protein
MSDNNDPWTRKVTKGGGAADTALIIVAFAAAAAFIALR